MHDAINHRERKNSLAPSLDTVHLSPPDANVDKLLQEQASPHDNEFGFFEDLFISADTPPETGPRHAKRTSPSLSLLSDGFDTPLLNTMEFGSPFAPSPAWDLFHTTTSATATPTTTATALATPRARSAKGGLTPPHAALYASAATTAAGGDWMPSQVWAQHANRPGSAPFRSLLQTRHAADAEGARNAWSVQRASAVNLAAQALGPNAWVPLSRPVYNAATGALIVGTESSVVQGPAGGGLQPLGLIVAQTSLHRQSELAVTRAGFFATTSSVRDCVWIDRHAQVALYVCDTGLGLFNGHQCAMLPVSEQPQSQPMRQIACDATYSLVGGGGQDKSVFISLISDQRSGVTRIKTVQTGDVVGSVGWLRNEPMVLTFTNDVGRFGLVDARESTQRIALESQVDMPDLYAHLQLDDNLFVLGFGSGLVSLFDVRRNRTLCVSRSAGDGMAIGDLVREPGNGARHVYGFGMGGISKWDVGQNGVRYQGYSSSLPSYDGVPLPARAYKTSGLVLNESTLLVSDSAGFM